MATEPPSQEILNRKPYKRSAALVSRPMIRNILVTSGYQLALMFILLFSGEHLFMVPKNGWCKSYDMVSSTQLWDPVTSKKTSNTSTAVDAISCQNFKSFCPSQDGYCFEAPHTSISKGYVFSFEKLDAFSDTCLKCSAKDFRHGTIIFNTFVWCQIFNEYTSRTFDGLNVFRGIEKNPSFILVSLFTMGFQVFCVEVAGIFFKTSHLTIEQWFICIGLGFLGILFGKYVY